MLSSRRRGIEVKLTLLARLGLVALGTGIIAASIGIGAQPTPKKIRILYTDDTLGYLEPPCN
jgi:hypothetical protein